MIRAHAAAVESINNVVEKLNKMLKAPSGVLFSCPEGGKNMSSFFEDNPYPEDIATVVTAAQKARDALLEAWVKVSNKGMRNYSPLGNKMSEADNALLSLMDYAFAMGRGSVAAMKAELEGLDADSVAQAVADALETQISGITGGKT